MIWRAAMALATLICAGQAQAGWRPSPRDLFDIQLTAPFQVARKADVLAMGAAETSPTRLQELQSRGVRLLCVINAGVWENWRPDSGAFDRRLIGNSVSGWAGERWLDIRALAALQPILARRLDLCRDKGFDGVLLRSLDGYQNSTGFPLSGKDQLAFNRWLAAESRARGLAAGMMNTGDLVPELADDFDYAVSDTCLEHATCGDYLPFRRADKGVFLIEYTNLQRKMDISCAAAVDLDMQVIFKTKSLNGKLHRRCP